MNKKLTMIGSIPRITHIVGFHFSKFGCCKPATLPTKLFSGFFLWSLAQNILSNEVKQVLHRRGGGARVAMEMQKKTR